MNDQTEKMIVHNNPYTPRSTLSHRDELIEEGLSAEQADIAVEIADRRQLPEVLLRVREALNFLCDRLPAKTTYGVILRRAILDDGSDLAKDAASLKVSRQSLWKSEERLRAMLAKDPVDAKPNIVGTNLKP